MKYAPKYFEPEELLLLRGFQSVNRGYAKEIRNYRLHALIYPEFIDLHCDTPDGDSHATHRFYHQVRSEIEMMERTDSLAKKKFIERFWEEIKSGKLKLSRKGLSIINY